MHPRWEPPCSRPRRICSTAGVEAPRHAPTTRHALPACCVAARELRRPTVCRRASPVRRRYYDVEVGTGAEAVEGKRVVGEPRHAQCAEQDSLRC